MDVQQVCSVNEEHLHGPSISSLGFDAVEAACNCANTRACPWLSFPHEPCGFVLIDKSTYEGMAMANSPG